ncbi:SDR family oxidoreductase [Planktothrix sp. FACHB-1355]|uniref:SDR family oxidoreductase n=1 Tax=Aerosakkonema funiforme FACHB-1375 TaxID=2949571 RepID=A0A926VAK0_9CYAN|nr:MULTISPECIES: SDR family oxidoreductase [Oscillatoriales]MBD2179823.1 SDR family oxidoreductase [Aerosakkonema funiforme FACHB-1375]MBD3557916.1 SDR family oxidoreductase [Planktothrix sp. FACHB-1355]
MSKEKFLTGRVAMVTGGASGMGRAMALAFAEGGADVAIGSRTASTSRCKAEIEARGVRALAIDLDVTSTDSVQAFYDAVVENFGKVDILANSAGIGLEQTICGHPDELWHQVIDINLNGAYRTIKLCLPGMISRRWGRIINIASTAASVGSATNPAYCTSKAAVVALTRCVALEGAPHGVSCNAISPGWVETDLGKNWMAELAESSGQSLEDYISATIQSNPQKRMIQPQEIGALALFLCRDEAFGITMQNLTVSAGSLW